MQKTDKTKLLGEFKPVDALTIYIIPFIPSFWAKEIDKSLFFIKMIKSLTKSQ
jgi:hypothetical protein